MKPPIARIRLRGNCTVRRLPRTGHPAIVPAFRGRVQIRSAAEGAIPPENAQAKEPRNRGQTRNSGERWRLWHPEDTSFGTRSTSTDGANLSGIEDRGVKRKKQFFRFTPFPFLEVTLKDVHKGLIC